jgi:hypothetical protein
MSLRWSGRANGKGALAVAEKTVITDHPYRDLNEPTRTLILSFRPFKT